MLSLFLKFLRRHGAARRAVPGRGSCCGGRPCGPTPLRFSQRARAAKFAALPSVVALKQSRRVRTRSARVRAPSALLRCSAPQKSPPPGTAHRAVTLAVFAARPPAPLLARWRRSSSGPVSDTMDAFALLIAATLNAGTALAIAGLG